MFARRLRLAALSLALLAPLAVQAGPYSNIYVFGDSLSDDGSDFNLSKGLNTATGGLFPIVPAAPGSSGHFSNGPVAVDYLAGTLGLSLSAHYLSPPAPFGTGATGGNNYAQGGATSGFVNASLPSTLNGFSTGFSGISQQVVDYKNSTPAADPNALYVVWSGANDFVHLGSVPAAPGCTGSVVAVAVCTAVTNVANSIATLAALGATHFLVPNLPDLGNTAQSIAAGPAQVAAAHAITVAYNAALANALGGLDAAFPMADIVPFDIFTFFDNVLADAGAYGFSNTTQQCLIGSADSASSVVSPACAAAGINSYLFWDGIHPTTHAHELIGLAMAAALGVPEPSELALLGLGVVALLGTSRRRRAAPAAGVSRAVMA